MRCPCPRTPTWTTASEVDGVDARLRPRRPHRHAGRRRPPAGRPPERAGRAGAAPVPAGRGGRGRRRDRPGRGPARRPRRRRARVVGVRHPPVAVDPVPHGRPRGGPLLASADEFHVTVHGRGGHASMPHDANDPVPVACEIVQAIQTWVTRRVDVFTPAVVTVASIQAGTTTNVIPEDGPHRRHHADRHTPGPGGRPGRGRAAGDQHRRRPRDGRRGADRRRLPGHGQRRRRRPARCSTSPGRSWATGPSRCRRR